MVISIILAHPDKNSFNHAIAATCLETCRQAGHLIHYHDLHEENFEAILPAAEIPKKGLVNDSIQKYCDELVNSDGIIIVHPNWWGMPPAILKGWIDRVLRPGAAYEFLDGDNGEGVPNGLLNARWAIVFNTSNTSEARENGIFKDPLETIWKNCIFDFCGVKDFYRTMFRIMVNSTQLERQQWLDEAEKTIRRVLA